MHISQLMYKAFNISYRGRKWYLRHLYPRIAPKKTQISMCDGTKLMLSPRYDYVQREIFLNRGSYDYEKHVIRWLNEEVKPGMVVVEVGAHIGYFTGHICRLITPTGKAFFIEPLPENYESLTWNLQKNHLTWAQALDLAVSKSREEIILYPAVDSGRNSISHNEITNKQPIHVQAITLDDLSTAYNLPTIDLLIVDVEGAEAFVLQGGRGMLSDRRVKTILCEFHPHQLQSDFGIAPKDFLVWVVGQGYIISRLDSSTGKETEFSNQFLSQYQHLVFRS